MKFLLTTLTLLTLASTSAIAQHTHGYAGDSNDDGYLDFESPLPTRTLSFADSNNKYFDEGFLYNGSFTFTGLDGRNIGTANQNPDGALSGTFIELVLYAVAGPMGATFGFYEAGSESVTLTMMTGMTGGTGTFALTEEAFFQATPSNPFGHIHGRRFVATEEGEYTITWALENRETTGTFDSQLNPDLGQRYFTQTFNAVPEPGTFALLVIAGGVAIFALGGRKRRQS